jgi:hypothetical protein
MLNDKQLEAIDELVAGKKRVEVEQSVGISHAQLYRWTLDPEFVQRWDRERARRHQERVERLWTVADRAMDVVLESLDEGDPKMAGDVLKLVARGLSDVGRIPAVPSEEAKSRAPLTGGGDQAAHTCGSCGRECKSAGALASHQRIHVASATEIVISRLEGGEDVRRGGVALTASELIGRRVAYTGLDRHGEPPICFPRGHRGRAPHPGRLSRSGPAVSLSCLGQGVSLLAEGSRVAGASSGRPGGSRATGLQRAGTPRNDIAHVEEPAR